MGGESSDEVRPDLGALLQVQMRIVKLESSYNSLIFDPREPIGNHGLRIF